MHRCVCPCGEAMESITCIVVECEMRKEERAVLEEQMKGTDECDMDEFGTLNRSEKTIAVVGNRWRPQAAKPEGDKVSKTFLYVLFEVWKQRNERPTVGGVCVLGLRRAFLSVSKGMSSQLWND